MQKCDSKRVKVLKLLIALVVLIAFPAMSQTTVYFNFTDPQYGLSQATNRTVVLQAESGTSVSGGSVLLPFKLTTTTDVNGYCVFSNLFGSAISGFYHITIPAPPQRADFDIWVSSTNLGYVNGNTILGVFGASTYPAAVFAWGAQVSDARYGPSTNATTNFVTFAYLNTVSNSLIASIQSQGTANTNFTLVTSNLLAAMISTNTTGTTASQVTNIVNQTILASNLAPYAAIANTNAATLAVVTNAVNTSSNALQSGYLGVIYSASNTVAAQSAAALVATNSQIISYVSGTYATTAALILTNFQNLQTDTNLIVILSNNVVPYTTGVSNLVVNNQGFAVGVSNTVTTVSNTVSANALTQIQGTNTALTSALIATNNAIISYVNTTVAGATNFGPVYSAINNASNTVAANSLSQLVSSNAAQTAALIATNGQIISYVQSYTGTQIATATNGIGATITLTSNALQTQAFAISNSLLGSVNGASNANSAFTLAISNNDVATLGFAKGVSNSVVAGTNTVTAWTLVQFVATNTPIAATNALNLNNASNYLLTVINSSNGLQTAAQAVLSNAVFTALNTTNILIQTAASNTALAMVTAANTGLSNQFVYGTNWLNTNLLAQIGNTNYANLVLTSNLVTSTSNGLVNLSSNYFVSATNYAATRGTNWDTYTTNLVGINGAGSGTANGTYANYNGGNLWTNINNPVLDVLLSGSTWYAQSNSITLYSWTAIPGAVTAVNGVLPVPSVYYGRQVNLNGQLFVGWANWFTNIVGTGGGSTNGFATNYAGVLSFTNLANTFAGQGANLTNINGAAIQAGTLGSNQVSYINLNQIFPQPSSGAGISTNYAGVVNFSTGPVMIGGNPISASNAVAAQLLATNNALKSVLAATNSDGPLFFGLNNDVTNIYGGALDYLGANVIEGSGNTVASGYNHAEGLNNAASGSESHVGGIGSTASGPESFAYGNYVLASGTESFANGHYTIAQGIQSYAGGSYIIASNNSFAWNDGSLGTALNRATSPNTNTVYFVASNGVYFAGANTGPFVNGTNLFALASTAGGGSSTNGLATIGYVQSVSNSLLPTVVSTINTNVLTLTGCGNFSVNGNYYYNGGSAPSAGAYGNSNNFELILNTTAPIGWTIYSNNTYLVYTNFVNSNPSPYAAGTFTATAIASNPPPVAVPNWSAYFVSLGVSNTFYTNGAFYGNGAGLSNITASAASGAPVNLGFQSVNTNIITASGFGTPGTYNANQVFTNAGGGQWTNMLGAAGGNYKISNIAGSGWIMYSNNFNYPIATLFDPNNYGLAYYGATWTTNNIRGIIVPSAGLTYSPQAWNMTPVTLNGVLNSTNLTWQITNAIAGNVNPNVVTNTQPQVIFGQVALTNAIINEINPLGNVGIGNTVLSSITTGAYNVAFGLYALSYDYTGNYNIAIGGNSLANLGAANSQGGSNNIAIGINSGVNFTVNESSNIDIGNPGIGGENNIIRIGTGQTDTYLTGVIHGNGAGLTGITAAQVGAVGTNQFALALTNNNDFTSAALDLRNGGQLGNLVDMASFVASEGYTNYSYTGQFITATNVTFTQRGAKFNHLGQIQWPAAVGPTNTVVIVWNQDTTNTDSIGGMLGGLQNTNTGDSEYFAYGGNSGGNLGWVNWFMASGTNVWPAAGGNITNLLQFVRQDGTYDYVTAARPRHVTMAQNNGQGQVLVWNDGVPAQWYKTSLTNQTFPIYPSAMNAIVLGQPLITNGMYYGTNTFAGYVESVQVYNTATFTNLPQLAVWVSDWLQAAHNKTFWLGDSRFAWQGASAGAGGSSAGTNIATFIDSLAGRSDFVSYQEFLGGSTVAGAGPATNIIAMNLPHGKIRTTEVEMGGGINDFRGAGTPVSVLNTISNYFYLPFAKAPGYYLDVWDVWQVGTNSSSNVTWSLTIQTNISNYDSMVWTNRAWIRNVYPCSAVVPQFMLNSNNVPRYSTDSLHFADPTNGIAAYSSLAGLYISLVNNPFTVPGQPLTTALDGTALTNLQSSALVGLLPTNTIPNGVLTTNGAASNGYIPYATNNGVGVLWAAAPSGGGFTPSAAQTNVLNYGITNNNASAVVINNTLTANSLVGTLGNAGLTGGAYNGAGITNLTGVPFFFYVQNKPDNGSGGYYPLNSGGTYQSGYWTVAQPIYAGNYLVNIGVGMPVTSTGTNQGYILYTNSNGGPVGVCAAFWISNSFTAFGFFQSNNIPLTITGTNLMGWVQMTNSPFNSAMNVSGGFSARPQ